MHLKLDEPRPEDEEKLLEVTAANLPRLPSVYAQRDEKRYLAKEIQDPVIYEIAIKQYYSRIEDAEEAETAYKAYHEVSPDDPRRDAIQAFFTRAVRGERLSAETIENCFKKAADKEGRPNHSTLEALDAVYLESCKAAKASRYSAMNFRHPCLKFGCVTRQPIMPRPSSSPAATGAFGPFALALK